MQYMMTGVDSSRGQVPVLVEGRPPVDAYLVPSGKEDGRARVLTDDENPANVFGQVVDEKVRGGRVKALVQKGMGTEPSNRYFARKIDAIYAENERVRSEKVATDADNMRLQAENDRLREVEGQLSGMHVTPPPPVSQAPPSPAYLDMEARGEEYSDDHSNADYEFLSDDGFPAEEDEDVAMPPQEIEAFDRVQQLLEVDRVALADAVGGGGADVHVAQAKGEWPWDEPGKLDFRGKVVTPAMATINRLSLRYKLITPGTGSKQLGRYSDSGPATCYSTAHATIVATGEKLTTEECVGMSIEESEQAAYRRLLELDNCKLVQLLEERERGEGGGNGGGGGGSAGEAGGGGVGQIGATVGSGGGDQCGDGGCGAASGPCIQGQGPSGASSGKERLNAMAMRMCQPDMSALQGQQLVLYAPSGGEAHQSVLTLSACQGRPFFTGPTASTVRISEHAAAERAIAFVGRIVASLSDSSYSFGFVPLSQLLRDLHEMGLAWHRDSPKGSFKELLHVIAMRLKRPSYLEPHEGDGSTSYLRYAVAPPAADGEELGRDEHATPLERSTVSFVRFDGIPTFTGAAAAGRKAAEQSAAEVALAFIVNQAAQLKQHEWTDMRPA